MDSIEYIDRRSGQLITERPPGEGYLKFLYHNPFGKLALNLLVKRKLISEIYGRMMSSPKSINKIQDFVEGLGIDMEEAVLPIKEFGSFNEFFYRQLKPTARPIGDGLVSPADAKLIAFKNIKDVGTFFIKGQDFTLKAFLQNDAVAEKHRNSSLLIFRLAPNDYHRFHFPYAGSASDISKISGSYYSVSPYALVTDFAKIFVENRREYLTLETSDKGEILLAPVGATMVGTIIETYQANTEVSKGDEMGYFAFGGSTVVMLIEEGQFVIDEDLITNTSEGKETAVRMGETIGR